MACIGEQLGNQASINGNPFAVVGFKSGVTIPRSIFSIFSFNEGVGVMTAYSTTVCLRIACAYMWPDRAHNICGLKSFDHENKKNLAPHRNYRLYGILCV